jgi:hypothetical protein
MGGQIGARRPEAKGKCVIGLNGKLHGESGVMKSTASDMTQPRRGSEVEQLGSTWLMLPNRVSAFQGKGAISVEGPVATLPEEARGPIPSFVGW